MFKCTEMLMLAALCALGLCSGSVVPQPATHELLDNQLAQLADIPIATRFFFFNTYTVYSKVTVTNNGTSNEVDYRKDGFSLLPNTVGDAPLDPERITVIIVHDFGGSSAEALKPDVKNSFLSLGDHDVIEVDWPGSTATSEVVLTYVSDMAEALSNVINLLVEADKIQLSNIHLVGFGIGAHVVGQTGRFYVNEKIPKITALDPAANGWGVNSLRLRKTDALAVEVIHTDTAGTGAYGLLDPLGHIDFYPNGGSRHLGCTTNVCWHERAWMFFAATITDPGVLRGYKCKDIADMNGNTCAGVRETMGGAELYKYQEGIFRLNTGRVHPFNE